MERNFYRLHRREKKTKKENMGKKNQDLFVQPMELNDVKGLNLEEANSAEVEGLLEGEDGGDVFMGGSAWGDTNKEQKRPWHPIDSQKVEREIMRNKRERLSYDRKKGGGKKYVNVVSRWGFGKKLEDKIAIRGAKTIKGVIGPLKVVRHEGP